VSPEPDDRALRDAFARLRREEAEAAPRFERSLAAARRTEGPAPGGWRRASLLGALPVAAAVALAIWIGGSPEPEGDWAEAGLHEVGAWYAPTDVLLETPGSELLREIEPAEESGLEFLIRLDVESRVNFNWRTVA
jgi:hypothetical protein